MRPRREDLPPKILLMISFMVALVVLCACCSQTAAPELRKDIFIDDRGGTRASAEKVIRTLLDKIDKVVVPSSLVIDYPLSNSIFPPEIVAPTFLWHDPDKSATGWLIDISFKTSPNHIYCLTAGMRSSAEIDPLAVTGTNVFQESDYQASAKGWTPDEFIWDVIKRYSTEEDARATITGLVRGSQNVSSVRSRGSVSYRTSKDPVGAPIFYRDVPLMPTSTKDGIVMPIKNDALPLIKWRLRDISKPSAPVVMEQLPTCGNCHSFSRSGQILAMDIDGPAGDKGTHVVKTISSRMVIEKEDVFSWNSFRGPNGEVSFGLFPQVSPDGRYVIATVHESLYVQNYMDYGFLQTFYPTRGVLAFYTKASGEIRTLPGADDRRYVQTNAIWSPDGEIVVFLRAEARDAYGQGPPAERANDPRETQIQFDLYRIPFNKGMGGQAEPIPGASRNGMSNSFPRFSPDGRWIAWVKCKNGLLMRPDSKLYIMPAGGGLPRLMKCNTSRMNSWHSWSPNGKWLVFTSKCNTPYTQMFLTHVDAEGNDSPAILIPNSTAANRAVNLPEFANIPPNGLIEITAPAVDYRRHMEKGKQLTDKGLLAEAQVELEKSLELKPDYPETLVSYGYLLSEQGQKDAAVEYFRKALAIEPRFYSAYVNWGVALTQTGKFDEAIGYFKKALEIYPECDSAQYNWGVALFQSGRLDEAAMHFGRAIEIGPIYAADARSFLGLIFLQRGKPAEAIPYFRDALKAKPESSSDHYHWGMALYRLASLEEAKDHFEKALALDPKHYRSQRYLGEVLIQQGKAENAIEHYRKAIALGPAYLPSYDSLARILATHPDARLRDGEEAVRLAELACRKSNMPNPGFLDTLACAYAEAKRFEDALQTAGQAFEFSRAVRDDKLVKEIQYHQILFKKRLACHDKN